MRVDSLLRFGGGVLVLLAGCELPSSQRPHPLPTADASSGRDATIGPATDAGVRDLDAPRPALDGGSSDAYARASSVLPETSTLHASLLVTADGSRAVVADVDGSCLYVLDLSVASIALAGPPPCIPLPDRSIPWRMVEDGAGRVHVVLRGTGQLATLERGASRATTRALCSEPRGLAWRASDDTILVACAEGVLVTLPASEGPATRRVPIDDDLRDVVVTSTDRVLLSRFRVAEVIEVDGDGRVLARWQPPSQQTPDILAVPGTPLSDITARQTLAPRVAWRMIAVDDEVWLLHQAHRVEGIPPVPPPPDAGFLTGAAYYGTPLLSPSPSFTPTACGAIVQSVLTRLDLGAAGAIASSLVLPDAVAVDLVSRPSARALAIVTEGAGLVQLALDVARSSVGCVDASVAEEQLTSGPVDAVGFVASRLTPLVLTRGPLRAEWVPRFGGGGDWVVLDERATDRGRALFNGVTPSGLACMSCHPEGGDDGHVWTNLPRPPVRTQTMRGGVLATAPFHWEGDFATFDALVDEVWTLRMGGFPFFGDDRTRFGAWIDGIPATAPPSEPADSVARGRALFTSSDVGCTACHSGPRFTNDLTLDVGTGGAFQVPSLLGVAYRAPYLHSGCATTLRDRFVGDAGCTGGDAHGHVSGLSSGDVDDLVSYLRTL